MRASRSDSAGSAPARRSRESGPVGRDGLFTHRAGDWERPTSGARSGRGWPIAAAILLLLGSLSLNRMLYRGGSALAYEASGLGVSLAAANQRADLAERELDALRGTIGSVHQRFLPPAVGKVLEAVGGGGDDLGALLGAGGIQSLLPRIDLGSLASESGVEASKASSGLQAMLLLLLSALQDKAGGTEGILSLLGGGSEAGALGGLAGKLFNR